MLRNAYLLAKIGADTTENDRKFAENLPKNYHSSGAAVASGALRSASAAAARACEYECKICKICKILQIFGGLVLGCIKTKICKKICV